MGVNIVFFALMWISHHLVPIDKGSWEMSLSLIQDGQSIPVDRSVSGFELSIPTDEGEFVAIVEILGKKVRFSERGGHTEESMTFDLAELNPIFENPGQNTIRTLICTGKKETNCIRYISVEYEKVEVGYLDKDSALVQLKLSKKSGAENSISSEKSTFNNSDSVSFPKCLGDYDKETWTNCFGTFSPKKDLEYVGVFKKGKPHGQGTYTLAGETLYVGELKKGNPHGQGTFTWPNGDKYVGGFRKGKPHGPGIHTLADGSVKEGFWEKGCLEGSCLKM